MLRQSDRSIEELCRAAVHYSTRTDSFPLETRVREHMEAAFGCDLSAIRLVSDCTGLAGLAPALASGKKILLAPGAYRPSEPSGLFLLAHEIAHNLQQHSAAWEPRRGLVRNASLEAEADIVAAFVCGAVNRGSVCISDHFETNCLSREAANGAFQAKLLIDSNVSAYRLLAQAALNQLTGSQPNGLNFVDTHGVLWGEWVEVEVGTGIAACRVARPRGTALVEAVIGNPYVTRIVNTALGNSATPERTSILHGPSLDYLRTRDQILQRSVLGSGTSCRIDWNGAAVMTMDIGPAGHIQPVQCPAFIALAHELIHADRCARGIVAGQRDQNVYVLIDQRPLKNLTGWATTYGHTVYHDPPPADRWFLRVSELMEELVTVGFPLPTPPPYRPAIPIPANPLGITENDIRQEHAHSVRVKYGDLYEANPSPSPRYIGNQ